MAYNTLNKFKKNLPEIYELAIESNNEKVFFEELKSIAKSTIESNQDSNRIKNANLILEMLEHEAQFIFELSRGDNIYIETFSLLWNFLRGNLDKGGSTDLHKDLCGWRALVSRREITPKATEQRSRLFRSDSLSYT